MLVSIWRLNHKLIWIIKHLVHIWGALLQSELWDKLDSWVLVCGLLQAAFLNVSGSYTNKQLKPEQNTHSRPFSSPKRSHSTQKTQSVCMCWRAFWRRFTMTCPLRSDGWSTAELLCRQRSTDAQVSEVQIPSKCISKKIWPLKHHLENTVQLKGDIFVSTVHKPLTPHLPDSWQEI